MVNKCASQMASPPQEKKSFPGSPFLETRAKCGSVCNRILHELWIRDRISDLFSSPNPRYALNGGAALHFLYLGGRIPNDIDLRCDDLEATRKALATRFEEVPRKTTVPVYGFLDRNGILIDLSQNRFPRTKKEFVFSQEISGFVSNKFTVISYDFEVLFAEKLIALARKGSATDLFDAYSCLSRESDLGRVAAQLREIGEQDKVNPSSILAPSYALDPKLGGVVPNIGISMDIMLENVREFVRSIL